MKEHKLDNPHVQNETFESDILGKSSQKIRETASMYTNGLNANKLKNVSQNDGQSHTEMVWSTVLRPSREVTRAKIPTCIGNKPTAEALAILFQEQKKKRELAAAVDSDSNSDILSDDSRDSRDNDGGKDKDVDKMNESHEKVFT